MFPDLVFRLLYSAEPKWSAQHELHNTLSKQKFTKVHKSSFRKRLGSAFRGLVCIHSLDVHSRRSFSCKMTVLSKVCMALVFGQAALGAPRGTLLSQFWLHHVCGKGYRQFRPFVMWGGDKT